MPAYTQQTWVNGPGGGTALSAARLNHMEVGIANAGGGGGGTVTVYASNALDATGDYVCDGTDDQIEIMDAISAAAPNGGKVILSDGTFQLSAPISLPASANDVTLIGMGGGNYTTAAATILYLSAGAVMIDARGNNTTLIMRDLSLVSQTATNNTVVLSIGDGGCDIRNCSIVGPGTGSHRAIEVLGTYTTVYIRDNYIQARGAGVYIATPYLAEISDNYLYTAGLGTEYCIEVLGDAADSGLYGEFSCRITGNWSDGNAAGVVHLAGFACDAIIESNHLWYDNETAIFLEDCSGVQVRGNFIADGDYVGGMIRLDNADNCIIADNTLFASYDDGGITLIDSDHNTIHGNQIIDCGSGSGQNDLHSGILIDGDSDANLVYGNKVGVSPGVGDTGHLKYGIRVDDATCDNNMVYGNDLIGSWVTAGFSDAGTGTITTASNRS